LREKNFFISRINRFLKKIKIKMSQQNNNIEVQKNSPETINKPETQKAYDVLNNS
jgi:hypothetical protein